MSRLRIAAIDFLNPAPLMWDFDHEPSRSVLRDRYAVQTMMPSACAAQLASGAANVGLVPVAALATTPGLLVAPGCVIASKGAIRSILLVFRRDRGLGSVRTVAADTSSRASLAYTQILFRRFWRIAARFEQHPPVLDRMLETADAALLIGDPALLALEDRAAREARTGERLEYLDLGTAWREHTGLPWVSAVWAVRAESLAGNDGVAGQLVEDLLASRDHGLLHRGDLVAEWARKLPVPPATIRNYLCDNIHYVLDEECQRGLNHFLALARDCQVLPAADSLHILES